jgi:aspartate kinase
MHVTNYLCPNHFNSMKVFKFGGASVNSVERVQKLGEILAHYPDEQLLIVISAMGKTTNALEKVAEAFFAGKQEEALSLFKIVKDQHLTTARYLLVTQALACESQLADFFTEVEWLLHDQPVREFDYYYDQIVCIGELLSTAIVSHYLNEAGFRNKWLDVRDIIRTDDHFREAVIDWDFTAQKVSKMKEWFAAERILLTQGFIGATDENESTTLGREGSDYTAAVFANLLDAENQTIWKDVPSVMNADPRHYPEAQPLPELNYAEVIEMAYYGAQVIHPKTIKPLQNKDIPLHVKCFLDPSLPGTVIHDEPVKGLPPIIVLKEQQVLLELRSRDFSFVAEQYAGTLYHMLESLLIKPNLTQNAAISFLCVADDHAEKIEKLALEASQLFDVQVTRDLSLLTVRHYTPSSLEQLIKDKTVILRQQTPDTIQVLVR